MRWVVQTVKIGDLCASKVSVCVGDHLEWKGAQNTVDSIGRILHQNYIFDVGIDQGSHCLSRSVDVGLIGSSEPLLRTPLLLKHERVLLVQHNLRDGSE